MSTRLVHGIKWLERTAERALAAGTLEPACELVLSYLTGEHTAAIGPETDRGGTTIPGRVRIVGPGGLSVVLGTADGCVLAVDVADVADKASSRADAGPVRIQRGRAAYHSGKARRRGPRDIAELAAWLKGTGYAITGAKTGSGHIPIEDQAGRTVYVMPSTASDNRSFANCVSDLRKITGLELRK